MHFTAVVLQQAGRSSDSSQRFHGAPDADGQVSAWCGARGSQLLRLGGGQHAWDSKSHGVAQRLLKGQLYLE